MPLRRLELHNFKSYKGTQIIEFGDAPFMCIIGPNGAGKSNLMDAISFVLGVKSAQLRSAQGRDLIYRGRRDDDAETVDEASSAHVLAVYEDDEAKEWKFKRSVVLNGGSTYTLNGRETSYKNYNAQLEKFNVLVKAKNFLVFQGDVESVASQDSKSLAALIDRISGSADLAAAYEKAKEDLDKTADTFTSNYAKKRSMASEVKHFKEQREEVKQWERLNRDKDAMIQRHLLWRLYHIIKEINESARKVEEANVRLVELRTAVEEEDRTYSDARKEAAQAGLKVKKAESNLNKAEKAFEDKRPEFVAVEAQIAHAERRAKESESVAERVEKDLERQTSSLEELQEAADELQKQMDDAAEKQRQKSAASGKVLTKSELDEYRTLRAQANAQNVAERQQADTLRRDLKTQRAALDSIVDKIQQAEARKSRLDTELEELNERNETMQARYDTRKAEREKLKNQLDAAQVERERINIKETETNEKLQDVYGKLLTAGADKRQSEREVKLNEVLTSLKRVFPGVHGRLVDLCKPTQQRYNLAVSTVLGRNIDAIVVDHEKVAIDCIEYMRSQRAGQATFIPLDTIQVKPVQEKYRNFAKGARLAIDCLEYAAPVEKAIQHACGSTLICDTMAVARHVCYDKGQEVKAVTLEGTIIHKSGLITGGQSSNQRQFSDKDVESLNRAKAEYLQKLAELSKAKPNTDDSLLASIARLDAELAISKDDLDAAKVRLASLRSDIASIDKDTKAMKPDRKAKEAALKRVADQLSGLEDTLNEADDDIFADFCDRIGVESIRDYEDVQLKMAREESEALERFSAQKARLGHQIEFETAQLERTKDRLNSLRARIDKATTSIEEHQATKSEIEAELATLQQAIEKHKDKLAKVNTAFDDSATEVQTARDGARKAQRALDKALKEIAVWNDEIEKSGSDRTAIYRKCRMDEIDLPLEEGDLADVPIEENPEDAMDIDDTQQPARANDYGIVPDFDLLEEEDKKSGKDEVGRELEAQISKMRGDLEKMVPNMKAVDRLADVEASMADAEREAEETRRDSKAAKDRFNELKRKRCELFNKAYGHMSGCIDKVYKDLTKSKTFQTGGVAFLSVEDAEEPYLSGVKYNVMPPGKAFVDMEQLSGGEKTMAALALLFSIHSYHPAPFFVLDEVDAALDPTNVSKLARYIRAQAQDNVQFLIISLKATLYEHADGLVGVYREQEENTSKVLSLDLRQYVE